MLQSRYWICSCALLAAVAGCSGSGPELAEVKGVLVSAGQPVPDASITFYPDVGRPSYATTDERGEFEMLYSEGRSGAVIGDHTVKVMTNAKAPPPPGPPGPSGSGRVSDSRRFEPPKEVTLDGAITVTQGMKPLELEVD